MRRRTLFILLSALCSASPSWAMRAHDYIDADQRTTVALRDAPAAPMLVAEGPPLANTIADDVLLPEPSGYVMLGLGLLLLLAMPTSTQQSEAIAPDPDKPSSL